MASECSVVTDAEGVAGKENVAECSSRDESGSQSRHLYSRNDCTNTPDIQDYCVVRRQRKAVHDPPSSSANVNTCLQEVSSSRSENIIHRRSKSETAIKSLKQPLPSRVCEGFELDVLLTPLSGGRLKKLSHPVANVSLFADSAPTPTPQNSRLTLTEAASKPRESVIPCASKNDKGLNNHVEVDVIENCIPQSMEVGGNCSLIPLQFLSQNNAIVCDDTEVDVFVRSFWDEESDQATLCFNQAVNFGDHKDSADGRIRKRSTKKGAARKEKKNVPSSTVKTKVAAGILKHKTKVTVGTTERKKSALGGTGKQKKKVAASTVASKNSKQHQSKAESNSRKLLSRSRQHTRTEYVMLMYGHMTLRPRKKVEVEANQKRSGSLMKKRKLSDKAIVAKSNKPREQRATRDNAAVRCSSRLGAKRPASDQQISHYAATKLPATSRSTSSKKSHSVLQPAKKRMTNHQSNNAGNVNPVLLSRNKENIEPTTATKPVHSCEVKAVADAGKGKKSRSVSTHSSYSVYLLLLLLSILI